jgi:polar amino acid transport system permease protein
MWQDLVDAAPRVGEGIWVTLYHTAVGALLAFGLSFVFGFMALSRHLLVRGVARTIVELFRGTSLVVQIYFFAFVLPQLDLGFRLEPLGAAALALGLNFGAYGSEIVRGAINAVPKAQWEATVALSLGRVQRMRRVILPQAFPEMVPPFTNLLVQMLKGSSLLFLIGITELAFELQDLRQDLGSVFAFSLGLVIYFVLAQVLVALMRFVEGRASARVGRGPRFAKQAMRAARLEPTAGGLG